MHQPDYLYSNIPFVINKKKHWDLVDGSEGETDIMAGKLRKNALENCPKKKINKTSKTYSLIGCAIRFVK